MEYIDVTPTPRILRMLGEIPFQPWQCFAELIDNSIDAFMHDKENGIINDNPEICINWSKPSVSSEDFQIEITDNASGMSVSQMKNAVRAGYSGNDPVHSLGLFGMGFNIATARLGDVTEIYSAKDIAEDYKGIRLDFSVMVENAEFKAPLVTLENKKNTQGTRIVISKIAVATQDNLNKKRRDICRQLGNVYAPLLENTKVKIIVNGIMVTPYKHCVWSENRYVIYKKKKVFAIQYINKTLGEAYFDKERNKYLTDSEVDNILQKNHDNMPKNIVKRAKKITGWIGVQRYGDPNDFGIDFIRNGRKILLSDKTVFYYYNEATGKNVLQYPKELGSTYGGRIVGEVHVDYLLPNYQKNDFNREDYSWTETLNALVGVGPFLEKDRKALGFIGENESPVAMLANAYRRPNAGTKQLCAPNTAAKEFAEYFEDGNPEYQDDTKWWQAAQESDADKAEHNDEQDTPVNPGEKSTADVAGILNGTANTTADSNIKKDEDNSGDENATDNSRDDKKNDNIITRPEEVINSSMSCLRENSVEETSLSIDYTYRADVPPMHVRAYRLLKGDIRHEGTAVPCAFENDGMDCTFVYNPRDSLFEQYQVQPRMMLLLYLSERFKYRDRAENDIVWIFDKFINSYMSDTKIDLGSLQERALNMFNSLRERTIMALDDCKVDALACVHDAFGEAEETSKKLLSNATLLRAFMAKEPEGFDAIYYVPENTLIRLINKFPEKYFDGIVFKALYEKIKLPDLKATERLREESKERVIMLLKDTLRVVRSTDKYTKNELARVSLSINILEEELV